MRIFATTSFPRENEVAGRLTFRASFFSLLFRCIVNIFIRLLEKCKVCTYMVAVRSYKRAVLDDYIYTPKYTQTFRRIIIFRSFLLY